MCRCTKQAIWEIKWALKDLVTHVAAPHVDYISSSSNHNSKMASEVGKLYGTEKTKDVLQNWHWASIAKSSGWSSERSFSATCVPSSWRLNSRIQDAMLNAGEWPEAKVRWINEKNVRIYLDLAKAWLNAETLLKWQLFSGVRMLHTTPRQCCWQMLDCTTGNNVSGKKSSRSRKTCRGNVESSVLY